MLALVVTKAGDQVTYRALFKQHMPELILKEARDTTKITLKSKLSSKLGGELHRCNVVKIENRRHTRRQSQINNFDPVDLDPIDFSAFEGSGYD
jgi:hypothetical protein